MADPTPTPAPAPKKGLNINFSKLAGVLAKVLGDKKTDAMLAGFVALVAANAFGVHITVAEAGAVLSAIAVVAKAVE